LSYAASCLKEAEWHNAAEFCAREEIKARLALAKSDAEPTHRDMAYFGASEAACYHYPGEDQQALRDAYCRGAAEYAPAVQSDAEPVAWTRDRIAKLLHDEAAKRKVSHLGLTETADIISSALAQSDADRASIMAREIWLNQENLKRIMSQDELRRLIETVLRAQSDAEPVRIGEDFGHDEMTTSHLAQSDAEPVRWEFRTRLTAGRAGKWILWLGDGKPDYDPKFYEIRPLYAGKPE